MSGLFRELKSLFRGLKSLFRELKSLFRGLKSLFRELKSLSRELKSLFCELKSLFRGLKRLFRELGNLRTGQRGLQRLSHSRLICSWHWKAAKRLRGYFLIRLPPKQITWFPRTQIGSEAFFLARCSSRMPPTNRRKAATKMQESATLKAGHQPWLEGTILS